MKKISVILRRSILPAAVLCLVPALCPFSVWKSVGNRLASDGELERLTQGSVTVLRLAAAAFAAVFFALAVWNKTAPESFSRFFASLASLPARCGRDAAPFFRDLRGAFGPEDSSFWMMLILFSAGLLIRLLRVGGPLLHDEAYSIAVWGRSDLFYAISDYHLPNNHVLHTVFLNLIYHLFGLSPELMRIPALLCGSLLIPAVWLLGRLVYNDFTALTAAGLTAFAPFLVFYSVNARGYTMQTLLTVLTVGLAVYGKRKRNVFAWFLLILLSGLNFFTLPVALYPFGGICVWLFLNVLFFRRENCGFENRWQLFKYLIFMGICVSMLSLLLYLPILRHSGWNSLFGNGYIGGTEAATYGQTMLSRITDNVNAFSGDLPRFVVVILAAGLILSPFMLRRNSAEHVSYTAAVLLWVLLLLPVQRPNLWPRTMTFLHPFLLLCAASGLCALRSLPKAGAAAGPVCAVLILCAGISQFRTAFLSRQTVGPDEAAVRLILEREGPNAANVHIAAAPEDDAPLWVYAEQYGLPRTVFDKRKSFNAVYVFVNPLNEDDLGPKDLPGMLDQFGPGNNFMVMESEEVLLNEPKGILYRFDARESAVRKSYGDYPEIIPAD